MGTAHVFGPRKPIPWYVALVFAMLIVLAILL